jgi:hypothetical protein
MIQHGRDDTSSNTILKVTCSPEMSNDFVPTTGRKTTADRIHRLDVEVVGREGNDLIEDIGRRTLSRGTDGFAPFPDCICSPYGQQVGVGGGPDLKTKLIRKTASPTLVWPSPLASPAHTGSGSELPLKM